MQALALEANAYFLLIRPSMLTSKWYGDSQRLTAAIFSLALKLAPCIIFLGEQARLGASCFAQML